MKKNRIFTLLSAVALTGLVACSNDTATTSGADSTTNNGTTDNTAITNTTSSGNYAAMADSFQMNSEAGRYRDVRTGNPIRISVDRNTGAKLNAETKEPISRYIYVMDDNWWVYDNEGSQLGKARMDNNKLLFEDNNNWVEYDVKWKNDDDESKIKAGDTKIKVEKDGDTKIKVGDKKIKTDEDGTKVKN
ncbi:MAG TPA: hypothetical protein VFR58_17835 [Flavisolibacter sp.]|nr:hypothetical protein [Flavisolibacter sp.]